MRIPRIGLGVKIGLILGVVALLGVAVTLFAMRKLDRGPLQPIAFSHRIHVQTKNINCFFCHQYAANSLNPGIPTVSKCVLCHKVIASQFPPIKRIFDYYDRNQPIPWVRVGRVPDFVFFSHQIHLTRGFDCSRCHGNVKAMDRIKLVQDFSMNFCTTCHDQNGASVDCYVCHR